MGEEWRAVVGWEGLYEVSDQGRARSLSRYANARLYKGQVLKITKHGTGYALIGMSNGSRRCTQLVHQLVLIAFRGPRPPGMDACHENGDRMDCRLHNLRWGTKQSNADDSLRHGTRMCGTGHWKHVLTEAEVVEIRQSSLSNREIAKLYAITPENVGYVRRRVTWKHVA